MKRGQLQLEAIICLAVFIGAAGLFLSQINGMGRASEQAVDSMEAKAMAELCCLASDSVYATGASELLAKTVCVALESRVKAVVNKQEKESSCLAGEVRLVQGSGKRILEVAQNEHYR